LTETRYLEAINLIRAIYPEARIFMCAGSSINGEAKELGVEDYDKRRFDEMLIRIREILGK
jgi:hypothetical protein